ncbi:MAG: OmpA family protein [Pseudanabaena sp. ELA607]
MTNKGPTSPSMPQRWSLISQSILRLTVVLGCSVVGLLAGLGMGILAPEWVWQPNLSNYRRTKTQFLLLSDVLFESGTAALRPQGIKLLDEIAAQLPLAKGNTRPTVRIQGHLDLKGAGGQEVYALSLSYMRAAAVKEYLMRLRGENTYNWLVIGYGAGRPLLGSDPETTERNSRRIEILIDD